MSYCRWSSDNWQCDVYCYADCGGGYTTWVAGRKPIIDGMPLTTKDMDFEKMMEIHNEQMTFLDTAKYRDLNLPYDGECFNDSTLEEFYERLNCLKEVGYNVPWYVFDTIENEMRNPR